MRFHVIAALIVASSLNSASADLPPRPFAVTTNYRAPSNSIKENEAIAHALSISRGGESEDVAVQPYPQTTVDDSQTMDAQAVHSQTMDSQISRGGNQSSPQTIDPKIEVCAVQSPPKKIALSTKAAVLAGCALAFNGGYVNGACLSGILTSGKTKQAAAAVTGAWTNSALGIASGNYDQFYFNAKCIGSYMAGSLISSLCNPFPTAFELSPDKVSPAFFIGSLLLFASSKIAKESGGANKSFIYLAAISCGIQNSVTSVLTSNLVRSAHFSGITSDIGTFLGQVLRGNDQNAMKLKVFIGLAASFWTGGLVSFSATNAYASSSLLFSAAAYLAIATSLFFAWGGLDH